MTPRAERPAHESCVYTFVEDVRGEGAAPVLDRVLALGCSGLTVAAAYHRARDVTPHGPARVTFRRDGVHFPPGDLFGRLVPPVQPGAEEEPLRALRSLTRERGAALHAWGVFCHNTTLGLEHPDVTQENCFGDRAAPADLCPSHPDVRAYAVALARSLARYDADAVVAESLHFGLFGHGYHHERSFVELGALAEYALGLCFCAHCRRIEGADAARAEAVRLVEEALDGRPRPETEGPPAAIMEFSLARRRTVTTLAAEVAEAVAAEGSRLIFIDLSGAAKGYADGLPMGGPAAGDAWRLGVDPAAVGSVVSGYAVLAYARDAARVAADLEAYRRALGPGRELRAVLRPGFPDTDSADHLAGKVTAAAKYADAVDYYAYGLTPFHVLDRISAAR
ncbi:hypothetical protein NE236_39780 [Actinoallomurus purpureus]|uniref:hypothetical protein n=1 Tax=Actinoallomurus purpureus TaxID=478114 RepID=UPI0020937072|nr:hypothetical protein [Actinoallomurus purpureus]MCO6011114.1 hypothetical protein [Actinoallomurus purpureus]